MTSPLVSIRGLEKRFDLSGSFLEQLRFEGGRLRRKQEAVHAINGVDLDVQRGEALCVVGESGSWRHSGRSSRHVRIGYPSNSARTS